jgi:hypothetical protein
MMGLALKDRIVGRAWPSPPANGADARGRVELRPPKDGHVHLGCGDVYLKGYLNIDLPPREGVASGTSRPDLEADVVSVTAPPESVTEVRLHHLFEHFDRAQALVLLMRWYSWLRPGGYVTIETPDFEACIDGYRERSLGEQSLILRHIFGSQEAPWAQHMDGWSQARFRHVLGELGFTKISTSPTLSDKRGLLVNIVVEAHRPKVGGPDREAQVRKACDILRESMNGTAASEQRLFARWQARLGELSADERT